MKKITLLCLFFASTVVFSQNLITDGTFSTQTGAITSGTTPWAGYNSQILGSGHAEDPLVGNINNAEGALRQDFTVVPLTTYKVTFDYKWVSGAGTYDMTVRFRRQTAPAGNLTISNVTGGTLNGTSDGLVVSTTPDTWFNASFNVTVPTGVSLSRLQFFKSNGNRPFRVDNVSVRKLATFDGSTDSDWATADNWDTNEIPDDDDVNIPSGQNVVISSTTGSTVGNIDIDAAGSLTINGGGSLVVNANSSGNITYNRTLVVDKWHLVGSPVVGETYNDTWVIDNNIASGTGGNRGITTFQNGTADPTTGQWVYMQSGGSGTFDSSTGYSLRIDTGGTVSFTGTYPTGTSDVKVTEDKTGFYEFNYVGGPTTLYFTFSGANAYTPSIMVTNINDSNVGASLTDSDTNITWVLDEGSATQTAGYLTGTDSYFKSTSVSAGTNLIYYTDGDPVGTRTVNGGTFTCWETNGKIDTAGPESAVDFVIEPVSGLAFTPTLITLDAQRFGTGNGLLDIEWVNENGTTSIVTAQPTARDNTGVFSSLSFDVSGLGITAGSGKSTLKIYLYSLQEAKQFGLANVKIDGVSEDVVLGYNSLADYEKATPYFGALIGSCK